MAGASTEKLAKLEASFERMQKQNIRERNKLKQALKKLEADEKKQQKEFYIERSNERKEFFWKLLQQLGYDFEDVCIIGGALALLKEKIDSGNAIEEINTCIEKYSELIKNPESGIDDKFLVKDYMEVEEETVEADLADDGIVLNEQ